MFQYNHNKHMPTCFCVRSPLVAGGYHQGSGPASNPYRLPLGAAVAVVTVVDVQRITSKYVPAEPERSFGDYTPGRFTWFIHDVRRPPEPIDTKGALGLREWKA